MKSHFDRKLSKRPWTT